MSLVAELREAAKHKGFGALPRRELYTLAADEIERLRKDIEDLKHDLERWMNIANAEVNK
jgi:hypothetical protein